MAARMITDTIAGRRLHRSIFLGVLLVLSTAFRSPTSAQETSSSAGQTPTAEQELDKKGLVDSQKERAVTKDDINSLLKKATDDTTLTDEVRQEIARQLQLATDHVTSTETFAEESVRLQSELEKLPTELPKLEARLKQGPVETVDDGAWKNDPALLVSNEKMAEAALAAAIEKSKATDNEIRRRAERRPLLPELRATVAQQISDVETQLQTPQPDATFLSEATRLRLVARARRLKVEAELLNQESRTYETTLKLWNLQRDVDERQVTYARGQAELWRKRVAAARQAQAEQEAKAARIAAAQSHPAVRELAEVNSDLAALNAKLVHRTGVVESKRTALQLQSDQRLKALESLKERADAANFSQAIGVFLRNQQSSLPNSNTLRLPAAERQREITELNVQLIDWEADRRALVDVDGDTQEAMRKINKEGMDEFEIAEIESQIKETLNAQRSTLAELIQNGTNQLSELVRADSLEKHFADQVDAERAWLAEHVLWVRSTELIGSQPGKFVGATRTLFDTRQWSVSLTRWLEGASRQRWLLILAVLALSLLAFMKSRLKARLREVGQLASKRNCTNFLLTLKGIVITLLIALPVPAMLLFFSWRTESFAHPDEPMFALGRAMQVVGWSWLVLEFVRHMAAPMGVGEAHLDWPTELLNGVRATGRHLLVTLLFPLLVAAYCEFSDDEQLITTYGRVAFLLAIAGAGIGLWRLVNPRGPVVASLCRAKDASSILWNSRWFWATAVMLAPIGLAAISAAGFHYTAVRLTGRVAATLSIGFLAIFVAAVLNRWLLVTYRHMAIQRSKERRRQMNEAAENDPDLAAVVIQDPEIKLDDINQQVSKIIRVSCAVVSAVVLYAVWVDVLPAFGFLDDIRLWENRMIAVGEDQEAPWVTSRHLLLFLVTTILTVMASRNIPGLMEIAVLQRLPLDAGARYAASMISRYLIILGGFLIAFQWIGIGWGSVQWLVAAMTVGLGFGLQEIFANFVSGIILLFERPVRVGDTVTISEITGTVTRIQIRATTLLDWDNKELIVPNREFVTGHLINWTLSNPMLRLICPVGVAYGSDTRLVTKLLYKVASEESEVLKTPEPVVVFDEFGDNSLNFELRFFVTGLTTFRRLRHQINLSIDDEFRQHGIEIAFPQRDLHVKTLPNELMSALQGASK